MSDDPSSARRILRRCGVRDGATRGARCRSRSPEQSQCQHDSSSPRRDRHAYVVVVSNSELLEDNSVDELLVASEVDVVVRSVVVLYEETH